MRDDDRDDDYRDVAERCRRRYRDWEDDEFARRRGESRATRKGIISFVMALLLGPITLGLFVVAGLMASTPGGLPDDSPEAMLLGLGLMACLGGMIVGGIVGINGWIERDGSMKVFAVVGTLVHALLLVGTLGLIVLGLLMG